MRDELIKLQPAFIRCGTARERVTLPLRKHALSPIRFYPRFRLHLGFDDAQPSQLRPITNLLLPSSSLSDGANREEQHRECFINGLTLETINHTSDISPMTEHTPVCS